MTPEPQPRRRAMIFHHPLPIAAGGTSGSQVRPFRMAAGFRDAGFDVTEVAGYAGERKRRMRRVERDLGRGERFDFVYSESSTLPTALTEPHHLPVSPFSDFAFFRRLRRHGVPVGLYYRDVHWRFDHYKEQVPWYQKAVTLPLYHYDWWQYRRSLDHLFLQTLDMRHALPAAWPEDRLTALPPGCDPSPTSAAREPPPLRLLYVGGVLPPLYDLRRMVAVVQRLDGVRLDLCCREAEWRTAAAAYGSLDSRKVRVVHRSGGELPALYAAAHAFLYCAEPYPYLDFVLPVKIFENLGYGLPMIAHARTAAGAFVAGQGLGWAVADAGELETLVARLRDEPGILAERRQLVRDVRPNHTWTARARRVAETLAPRGKER